MSDASQEIELKFLCDPADVDALLGAAPAGEDKVKELLSAYFDTPDEQLGKAGVSLRVRRSGDSRVQTYKRGAGLAREEHEAPVAGDEPDLSAAPFAGLISEAAAKKLQPAYCVQVRRRQRLLRQGEAEIELALDQGHIAADSASEAICELELELKAGAPAALFALARELSHAAPLYRSFDSKAAQGAMLRGGRLHAPRKSGRIRLAKDATAAEAFQAVARDALSQIAANARLLREGDSVDAVHQLRVGARRLRSTLKAFAPVVAPDPADETVPRLAEELKWLAGAAGTAREIDVFLADMVVPAAERTPPPAGLNALQGALKTAREAAYGKLAAAVGSSRFRALLIDADAFVETGGWLAASVQVDRPAAAYGAEVLKARRKKLLKAARDLAHADDEARHHTRIQGKKLRYTFEAFRPLYDAKAGDRFIDVLKDLQTVLGELNDIAVAQGLASDDLKLKGPALFAAGQIIGYGAAGRRRRIKAAGKLAKALEDARTPWG